MILGKWDRERIVKWVEANSFKEEAQALAKDEHDLAERIRVSHNGGPEACAQVDGAPEYFFRTQGSCWCASGWIMHLRTYDRFTASAAPTFNGEEWRGESNAIARRHDELANRRQEVSAELNKVLMTLRTTKRIREVMPEIAHMLPDEPVKGSNLPAVIIDVEAARQSLLNAGVIKAGGEK